MHRPWEIAPSGAAADQVRALQAALPTLETDRLILRAARISDFDAWAGVATTDRAAGFGGPMSRDAAWDDFNQMVASWLLRGFGLFTITDKNSGGIYGFAPCDHECGDPEAEIGWVLCANAEGKGYAREAGAAVRDHALQLLGQVVAYSSPTNVASHRVSEALGGTRDHAAEAALNSGAFVHRFGGAA